MLVLTSDLGQIPPQEVSLAASRAIRPSITTSGAFFQLAVMRAAASRSAPVSIPLVGATLPASSARL